MTRAVPLIAALAAGLAGCQGRASLQEVRNTLQPQDKRAYATRAAWFHNGQGGRQTLLLAFEPTADGGGGEPARAGGAADREPIRYRLYLMLEVQEGGGAFTIGQRTAGGRVRAFLWVYNEREELAQAVPDRYGTIQTRVWPLLGGLAPEDWWVSGSFDLLMAGDVKLSGRFTATPGKYVVEKFLKEKRL